VALKDTLAGQDLSSQEGNELDRKTKKEAKKIAHKARVVWGKVDKVLEFGYPLVGVFRYEILAQLLTEEANNPSNFGNGVNYQFLEERVSQNREYYISQNFDGEQKLKLLNQTSAIQEVTAEILRVVTSEATLSLEDFLANETLMRTRDKIAQIIPGPPSSSEATFTPPDTPNAVFIPGEQNQQQAS